MTQDKEVEEILMWHTIQYTDKSLSTDQAIEKLNHHYRKKFADESDKYQELLYAVESKFPNETRHETALRYIKQAEQGSGQASEQLIKEVRDSDE